MSVEKEVFPFMAQDKQLYAMELQGNFSLFSRAPYSQGVVQLYLKHILQLGILHVYLILLGYINDVSESMYIFLN